MLPEIWGKFGWNFLHLVTVAYPSNPNETEKQHFYDYFHALKHVLPCEKCRVNMISHLKKFPLTDDILSCRKKLIKWGIDLHNVVNYYTGKEMLSYTAALNEINKLMTRQPTTTNKFLLILIIILIIMSLVIYYYFVRKN